MELTNEFSVDASVDEAWAVLTDLERVAPCMPGLELQEVDGDEYRGVVRVKVGPVVARYEGVASFQERDEANHRVVVRAEGREARGQGNAAAIVTATLVPEGRGTRVTVHTDLTITGRVAQFGRGVLVDVSRRLLGQFVASLDADLLSRAAVAASGAAEDDAARDVPAANGRAVPAVPRRIESKAAGPVDLLATAGPSLLKRVGPVVLLLLVVALWLLLRD